MCGLFGIYSPKIINCGEILRALALQSTIRGMDATGVAWIGSSGRIRIRKAPVPAWKFDFRNIKTHVAIGHVRLATHGSPEKNYNNHPYVSRDKKFALAHNGIVCTARPLPRTHIESDSYRIVQLCELIGNLPSACKHLNGVYAIEKLNADGSVEFATQQAPLCIATIGDLVIWTSTYDILKLALPDIEFDDILHLHDGDYVTIRNGKIKR